MIHAQPQLLITDDDRLIRETLSRAFQRHDMGIHLASNGEEAIAIIQEKEIHVVLIDLHMPSISGLETVRRLRKEHKQLPCILISGAVTDEVLSKAELAGIRSVIPKPLNFATTLSCVQEALRETYDWQLCAK